MAGGEVITGLDQEDRDYFERQFNRIFDCIEKKKDEKDCSIHRANYNMRMARTEARVDEVSTEIASVKAISSWHTWAIRLLIAGLIGAGGIGGYVAFG